MSGTSEQLGHAVYESTRRSVEKAWPEVASAENLLGMVASALAHLGGTVEGFRQLSGADMACKSGCSFCCWLRIDVRAHEVFLILKELKASRTASEMMALRSSAADVQASLTGLDLAQRDAVQRPCLLLRDGLCSVYDVRPAPCRRYLSASVAACEALWNGQPLDADIQHPVIAGMGRYAATALHNTFVKNGYDGYSYDLPMALAEALENPDCEARWLAGEKAFSKAAESKTPPEFSQDAALAGLRASLRKQESGA